MTQEKPPSRAGRHPKAPQKITILLPQHRADELQRLADEAGVARSTFAANIVERYMLQDGQILSNDIIATRLEAITTQHAQQFAQRFGDVVLRMAHETTALRRQYIEDSAQRIGAEAAKKAADDAWGRAVASLRPYSQRVRGDQGDEAQP